MNILFLCTGNSCRSIIAEALLNDLAPAGIRAQSAGSKPTGAVHPNALAALRQAGISTEGLYSKSWDNLTVVPDVVITLCQSAAAETCPVYLSNTAIQAHWGLPDPAHIQGDDATRAAAFDNTLTVLQTRIQTLLKALTQTPHLTPLEIRVLLASLAENK